jgi:hypothetical protein
VGVDGQLRPGARIKAVGVVFFMCLVAVALVGYPCNKNSLMREVLRLLAGNSWTGQCADTKELK